MGSVLAILRAPRRSETYYSFIQDSKTNTSVQGPEIAGLLQPRRIAMEAQCLCFVLPEGSFAEAFCTSEFQTQQESDDVPRTP